MASVPIQRDRIARLERDRLNRERMERERAAKEEADRLAAIAAAEERKRIKAAERVSRRDFS